jgi:radical SAM-linked protein
VARVRPGEAANPAPPTVQRIRVRFAKRGRLRFLSHRDVARSVERAVRRAGIPVAHSHGFSPHPRLSWIGAAPTGSASEAEYLEIGLAEVVDPAVIHGQLEEALPDGLDVLEVVESPGGSLADRLEASRWQIDLALPVDAVTAAVAAFLARETVGVERMTKKGLRSFDSRAAVLALEVTPGDPAYDAGSRLTVVLRHTEPAVRPDDVLSGLTRVGGLEIGGAPRVTRLSQGPLDEATGSIGDPLST